MSALQHSSNLRVKMSHARHSVTTGTVPLVTFSWENVTMGTVPFVTLLVYAAFFSPSNRMYQYTPSTAVKITAL